MKGDVSALKHSSTHQLSFNIDWRRSWIPWFKWGKFYWAICLQKFWVSSIKKVAKDCNSNYLVILMERSRYDEQKTQISVGRSVHVQKDVHLCEKFNRFFCKGKWCISVLWCSYRAVKTAGHPQDYLILSTLSPEANEKLLNFDFDWEQTEKPFVHLFQRVS